MTRRTVGRRKRANKRFKRDIQRAAFLLCVGLCDYGAMRKVSSSVGCPLSGRYVLSEKDVNYAFKVALFVLLLHLTSSM